MLLLLALLAVLSRPFEAAFPFLVVAPSDAVAPFCFGPPDLGFGSALGPAQVAALLEAALLPLVGSAREAALLEEALLGVFVAFATGGV